MRDRISGKTFFVTGGAGFIGSNMVERLLDSGAGVIVYDNLSSGRYEFIKRFESKKNFAFIKADLLDRGKLGNAMKSDEIDAIVHLAANPDIMRSITETDLDLKQGTIATYNVLDEARQRGIKEILFSSSSVVYGIPTLRPTPENYGPLKPISLYGSSKLACEGLITAFSHLYGIRYYIYRFANVVGKNATHGVISDFAKKLKKNKDELEVLGNGRQKKSYIEVGDCIDGMIYVYNESEDAENIFNLATDDQASVREIAEMVIDKFAKGAGIRYTGTEQGWPGDIANTFLSNKKISAFGWKPRCTSLEAIKIAIDIAYESSKKDG